MSDLIKAKEVAKMLCIAQSTVYEWARIGKIPSVPMSKNIIRFSRTKILLWIDQQADNRAMKDLR